MPKRSGSSGEQRLTEFESTVLTAVGELGGSATDFAVANRTGMLLDPVRRVMRRVRGKDVLVVEETTGPAYCGGGGTMLVGRVPSKRARA